MIQRRTKENSNQINKFDKEDVDPNDIELTMLLEGMAVEKNGKVHKVKGLHPELTAVANASKHEKLLLTPKQMDQKKRNFMRGYHKWPKAIVPYTINKSRIVQQRSYDIIKTAVEIFNARTCLKWLPYTPELAKELGHDHFKSLQIPMAVFLISGTCPLVGMKSD